VNVASDDLASYFKNLDRKMNKLKKEHEQEVINLFEQYTTHSKDN